MLLKNMRNPLNGLYFHAIDTSKEAFWCDKVIQGFHSIAG